MSSWCASDLLRNSQLKCNAETQESVYYAGDSENTAQAQYLELIQQQFRRTMKGGDSQNNASETQTPKGSVLNTSYLLRNSQLKDAADTQESVYYDGNHENTAQADYLELIKQQFHDEMGGTKNEQHRATTEDDVNDHGQEMMESGKEASPNLKDLIDDTVRQQQHSVNYETPPTSLPSPRESLIAPSAMRNCDGNGSQAPQTAVEKVNSGEETNQKITTSHEDKQKCSASGGSQTVSKSVEEAGKRVSGQAHDKWDDSDARIRFSPLIKAIPKSQRNCREQDAGRKNESRRNCPDSAKDGELLKIQSDNEEADSRPSPHNLPIGFLYREISQVELVEQNITTNHNDASTSGVQNSPTRVARQASSTPNQMEPPPAQREIDLVIPQDDEEAHWLDEESCCSTQSLVLLDYNPTATNNKKPKGGTTAVPSDIDAMVQATSTWRSAENNGRQQEEDASGASNDDQSTTGELSSEEIPGKSALDKSMADEEGDSASGRNEGDTKHTAEKNKVAENGSINEGRKALENKTKNPTNSSSPPRKRRRSHKEFGSVGKRRTSLPGGNSGVWYSKINSFLPSGRRRNKDKRKSQHSKELIISPVVAVKSTNVLTDVSNTLVDRRKESKGPTRDVSSIGVVSMENSPKRTDNSHGKIRNGISSGPNSETTEEGSIFRKRRQLSLGFVPVAKASEKRFTQKTIVEMFGR